MIIYALARSKDYGYYGLASTIYATLSRTAEGCEALCTPINAQGAWNCRPGTWEPRKILLKRVEKARE